MTTGYKLEKFLIAEDLMLLLLRNEKGTIIHQAATPGLLGGALLSELALLERIDMVAKKGFFGKRKLLTLGQGALPDPLLQQVHDEVGAQPQDAQTVLTKISKELQEVVPARLVSHGLVQQIEKQLMPFVTETRYPSVDGSRERVVRSEIKGVLVDGLTARPRIATLITLLSAVATLKRVLKDQDVTWSAEVKERAKEIRKGHWGAGVVSPAIAASVSGIASDAAAIGTFESS